MHGTELINQINEEIQLKEDECCIIFDLGCYFPYANPEILTFDFSLGEEKFNDYKKNRRYPNSSYQTISKKYKRKVSRLGYPYIMKFDEQDIMLFCVNIGIKEEYVSLVFPLQTKMTKDKPICSLKLLYNFDENKFRFLSHEKQENGGWYQHNWLSHDYDIKNENDTVLKTPHRIEDSLTMVYEDIIEPCPSMIADLLML